MNQGNSQGDQEYNKYTQFKKTYKDIDLTSDGDVKKDDFIIGKLSGMPIKKVVLKKGQELFETNAFMDMVNKNKNQYKYSTSSDESKKKSVSISSSSGIANSDSSDNEEAESNKKKQESINNTNKNNNNNINAVNINTTNNIKKELIVSNTSATAFNTNKSQAKTIEDFDRVFENILIDTDKNDLSENKEKEAHSENELNLENLKLSGSKEKLKTKREQNESNNNINNINNNSNNNVDDSRNKLNLSRRIPFEHINQINNPNIKPLNVTNQIIPEDLGEDINLNSNVKSLKKTNMISPDQSPIPMTQDLNNTPLSQFRTNRKIINDDDEDEENEEVSLKKNKLNNTKKDKAFKEKQEKERLEQERIDQEIIEKKERDRSEKKRKLEKEKEEKAESERLRKIEKEKKEKADKEKIRLKKEKEKLEEEQAEKERIEKIEAEKEKERLKKEKIDKKKQEKEKQAQEKLAHEKLAQEKLAQERLEQDKLLEQERLEKERIEKAERANIKNNKRDINKENIDIKDNIKNKRKSIDDKIETNKVYVEDFQNQQYEDYGENIVNNNDSLEDKLKNKTDKVDKNNEEDKERKNKLRIKSTKGENTYKGKSSLLSKLIHPVIKTNTTGSGKKRKASEILNLTASDFNLTSSDFEEETADAIARKNKEGKKETIIQNRALKEIKKRLRNNAKKLNEVDLVSHDDEEEKRYSQRNRIPRLNRFAGERIIYQVDKQTKCLQAVSVLIVNEIKFHKEDIRSMVHRPKSKKKHLVKKSDRLEREEKIKYDEKEEDELDEDMSHMNRLFVIPPGSEKDESRNFDSRLRCEIVKPSDDFIVKIGNDISQNLKKGSYFEVKPKQLYRISNLSKTQELKIYFKILE